MALEHPRLLAASLTAVVLGSSCSTPPESGAAPESPGEPMAGDTAAGQGQDPRQSALEQKVSQERRAALVANYLVTAQNLRANGNLAAAKSELLKAKELAPGNEEVRTLLASVQAELGEPAGRIVTYAEEQMRLRQIGEDRARAAVASQLQKAREAIAAKNYAGALEELRLAALAIQLKDDYDWGSLPQDVAAAQGEAQRLYDQQQRESQTRVNAELAERLRQENAEMEARRRAQVDSLIQESQLAFERRAFGRAQELAQRALQLEPQNTIAFEMQNAAVKAGRDDVTESYYNQRAQALRAMIEADEELKIPQTSILELDMATWERANGRAARSLNLITGVQILTTPEAREIINTESLKVVLELAGSITLENFLNHMVGRSESLAWTVKNGVVVIGNKSQAAGTIVSDIYPVKDLIFKRTQFLPPRISSIPGESSEDTPRTGSEGDDPVAGIELGDLVNNLKEATDPKYWESEGVAINAEDTGLLSVQASPEMHAKVLQVLADMRRFATPIVTIDSKFLTISRNFLSEIGIDFRGLGGSGNKGSDVSLDDVTNGLQNNASRGLDNGGTGDPAANPLAGAFFNDGGDGDIRGRTENFFTNDLGRVLSPNGGLTAGWTLIDDTQLNLILRAVEKRQDAEIMNSQILSVLNRERGHVAVINQTAYVRDFDVEVAQAAFIADPKIDVIQDGIVLDVTPVIHHDRKYITLNLNPTVAELQRPIPTFTTSLAGSTLPVTLQLPNLTVTNFATTAKVPDGGTVLIGGLRQMLVKERRAEVPVLATLPLISFLFKQEGTADENRSLMVMVRAHVTDVRR